MADARASVRRITLGFACNNACVFCAQGDLRSLRSALVVADAGDVERAIAAITEGEEVAFVGGEPTIFEGLPGWIRAAGERGASRVVVQTNGRRLAYRAYARALREASQGTTALALDVSLHGATAAMHEWHTGTPGSFGQTVQGLRNARAERVEVGVTVVVTRSSFRHLVEITRVAHAAGAGAVHFAIVEPFGRALRDRARLAPPAELVTPHLQRAILEARRLGMRTLAGDRVEAGEIFAGLGEVEGREQG